VEFKAAPDGQEASTADPTLGSIAAETSASETAPAAGEGAASRFLAGGGELGALIRGYDWSDTPLGPPQLWPQSLRTALRIMLSSRQPIWIGWGPELTKLYNDPYKSIIGGKHPWALGRPASEVWKEIWTEIRPMLDTAMGGVEGTYVEELLLIMERNGYPEETYYTFSYSPIPDDDGTPGGIICANTDDTQRVIDERQLALLRQLSSQTVDVRTWTQACQCSVQALATNARDITFALLYMAPAADSEVLTLAASTGLGPEALARAPATLRLDTEAPWPVARVLRDHETRVVDLDAAMDGDAPGGAWDRGSREAAVMAIAPSGETGRSGVLVVGLNPFRLFDANYRGFLGLAAGQIAAAVANGDAREEERRRAEALAELNRAKTAFFSNVSHEFRTPLTLMLGPLEDVLAGHGGAGHVRKQVALAHRNGVRLLRLVNSLLDFSRIEAGRVLAAYEPTDLAALTGEIASSFRSVVERAGLALKLDCQPLPQPVYVDRQMWEKILLNLISNAFKFTLEGEIQVAVAPSSDGRSAVVQVRDTGIGIPTAEIPRLFERFHRVEGAQGRSFEGSGIGLALVNELVKLHGGEIAVESAVDAGASFTIALPYGRRHLPADQIREQDGGGEQTGSRAQEYIEEALRWLPDVAPEMEASGELSTAGLNAIATQGGARPGAGKRLLLADDNADMRSYVARLLESQGYTVLQAADGEAALAAARSAAPDLVLTDVMMPKLDGFGMLRAIREDPALASLPVIMLSARAGEEAKVEGLEAGADDYLIKPFAARELLARVNANIQMAEIRREANRAVFASEQRYLMTQDRLSLALSTGRVAVFEWDVEDDRLVIQGPLAEVFGVPKQEAERGLPLTDFVSGVHPDDRDRVLAAIDRSVMHGEIYEAECRVLGGGVERVVIARGQVAADAAGRRRMAGAIIDVTEEKAASRALEALNAGLEQRVASEVAQRFQAEEALRQAQKMEAVGQLTGGVAHDFNNLLTVIIGGLDTIRRTKPGEDARVRRAAEMALQGAQRAANLTTRLLAFSRRQPLEPKALDLNYLVRDMTDLLHRSLGEQVELEGVLAPRLWGIEADQNQLESAILNLAVNARDAMPEGGKLTIETANTALDETYAAVDAEVIPGQYVMISVSDTGCGMSNETLAHVFEPFFTTKEVGRGTGLGLSMVYGFVKQSGGHVTLYSEEGQGTTVKLYFPRYLGDGETEDVRAERAVPHGSAGEVVLLVEDNDDVRAYSAMILTELGYRVVEAAHADAALAILRTDQRIDLLFTDVVLPGRSGRGLADAAAEVRPGLKVLFTTGYSRNAIVHHGRLDAGVQLITKPFTFEQLATRVRDLLDRPVERRTPPV
jgi:signal transduction histidine kinase/DNA-binding response OmpR family regulator